MPNLYDNVDDASTGTDLIKSISYEADGQTNKISYANGVTTDFDYDAYRRWVTRITTGKADATPLRRVGYSRDSAGRIIKIATDGEVDDWEYTYDNLDRLKRAINVNTATASSEDRTFTYDSAGNLTYQSFIGTYGYPGASVTATRPHAQTTIKNTSGTLQRSFSYDANGNMTVAKRYQSDGTTEDAARRRTIAYDLENRPVSVQIGTADDNVTTQTLYGPDGERVRKTVLTEVDVID